MANEGRLLNFGRISTGDTVEDLATGGDPADALGGKRGSLVYTYPDGGSASGFEDFTAAQDNPIAIDADSVSKDASSMAGGMLTILEGEFAGFQSLVTANSGTKYTLEEPTPGAVATGTAFQITLPNAVFPDASNAQSASGYTQYRCISFEQHIPGVDLADALVYLILNDPGECDWEFCVSSVTLSSSILEHEINPDEITAPYIDGVDGPILGWSSGGVGSSPPDYFSLNVTREAPFEQPKLSGSGGAEWDTSDSGTDHPIWVWLKRTVRPNARPRSDCWVTLVVEPSNTGLDPDPVRAYMAIGYSIDGFTEQLSVTINNAARIGAGTLVEIASTSLENGLPIAGSSPTVNVKTGDVGSIGGQPNPLTGSDGKATVSYLSSTDQADAGKSVDIEVHI